MSDETHERYMAQGAAPKPLFWLPRVAAVDHSRLPLDGVPSVDGIPLALHASLTGGATARRIANAERAREATGRRLLRALAGVGIEATLTPARPHSLLARVSPSMHRLCFLDATVWVAVEDGHCVLQLDVEVPVPKRKRRYRAAMCKLVQALADTCMTFGTPAAARALVLAAAAYDLHAWGS